MDELPNSIAIMQLHKDCLNNEHAQSTPLLHWIERNHFYNCSLWQEEDQARRTQVDATEIAKNKRNIDRYNQARNDAIEKIDTELLDIFKATTPKQTARLNSETAGAMIDRMSILSLKIFHMHLQVKRHDTSEQHQTQCTEKLATLKQQLKDLASCFDQLMHDTQQGNAYFKIYRQHKMYNDKTLNPYLYQKG